MKPTIATLKALLKVCVTVELLRSTDQAFAAACTTAFWALREHLPRGQWDRASDVIARLVRTRLERRASEDARLQDDPEFVTVCDQRIAESIEHQEARHAAWLRTVASKRTVAL